MPRVVAPFGAKLFVYERRRVAQRSQERVHLLAIGDTRLQFTARLVPSQFALGLVRQPPFPAVVAQPQQLALAAQLLARKIVKGIDLVGGWRLLVKAQLAQFLLKRF